MSPPKTRYQIEVSRMFSAEVYADNEADARELFGMCMNEIEITAGSMALSAEHFAPAFGTPVELLETHTEDE